MENSKYQEQWMEITPGRCRRNKKTVGQHIAELKEQVHQVYNMVRGNMSRRSFGFVLGDLWLIGEPILYAGLYYFLVSVLFRVRGNDIGFFLIFTSVIFWRLHLRMLLASPNMVSAKASVLKQTNFPFQMIIYEFVGNELGFFLFKLIVLFTFLIFGGIFPKATWLLLPFVLITQLTFTMSLVMIFASLGIFVKDISRIIGVLVPIWWYLSPGMYGISRVPPEYRTFFKLNPFSHILPAYRDILLHDKTPELWPLLFIFGVSLATFILGVKLLNRSRYYLYKYT